MQLDSMYRAEQFAVGQMGRFQEVSDVKYAQTPQLCYDLRYSQKPKQAKTKEPSFQQKYREYRRLVTARTASTQNDDI